MHIDSFFADESPSGAGPGPGPRAGVRGDAPFEAEWLVSEGTADHRPRQAAYVVTIMVLALGLAGAVVAAVIGTRSADAWRATAERRAGDVASVQLERDQARRDLLEAQASLASAQDELAATVSRLDAANAQVKTLTTEKAAMIDKATFVPAAVEMSTSLAQSISACALQVQGGGSEPIPASPGAGDTVAVLAPAPETNDPCGQAKADSEAFTRWLSTQ